MPVPIAVAIRQQIVVRRQSGKNLGEIARDLGLPYDSVRNVWRLYQSEGRIKPNYENCGPKEVKVCKKVYRAASFLKYLHPTWGAPLIKQLIQEKWQDEPVPSERSLQRWFKRAGINQPRKKQLGDARKGRGKAAHNVWEMDSREEIQLASGQKVVWLVVSDEASGAILKGSIFPHRQSQPTECRSSE
jgi:hypothetical protein